MELYVVDAFTDQMFGGNPAGVVLWEDQADFPSAVCMQAIAAELKHSETAFVKSAGPDAFAIRYFTPRSEVDLCGHATVSSFTVLRDEKGLSPGEYTAHTPAGSIGVVVEPDAVWMGMAPGRVKKYLTPAESAEVYQAYGLSLHDKPEILQPCIVSTGLPDILLPVGSREKLEQADQRRDAVLELSQKHRVVGVHMYYLTPSAEVTAYCRNFAPLCGIDEEAATGTSNGALSYYLYESGLIRADTENTFIQGLSLGRPSVIKTRVSGKGEVSVGGHAVISVRGDIRV